MDKMTQPQPAKDVEREVIQVVGGLLRKLTVVDNLYLSGDELSFRWIDGNLHSRQVVLKVAVPELNLPTPTGRIVTAEGTIVTKIS